MSSSQNARPRPLNPCKGLKMFRAAKSLVFEDDSPVITGGVQQRPDAGRKTIPAPKSHAVETYHSEQPGNFVPPVAYIRFPKRSSSEEITGAQEYSLQIDDEQWLINHPNLTLTPELFERIIDVLEKASGFDGPISQTDAETLLASEIVIEKGDFQIVVNDIYTYWKQKRLKSGKPLLQRFWPGTSANDTDPHKVFRPREKERYKLRRSRVNDVDSLNKIQQLKDDFDKLLNIMEMTITRERVKQAALEVQQEMFEQAVYDSTCTTGELRQLNIIPGEFKQRFQPPPTMTDNIVKPEEILEKQKKSKKKERVESKERVANTAERSASQVLEQTFEPFLLPSFMDDFCNRKSCCLPLERVEPSLPFFPANEKSHAIIKFRSRGRYGRGGRVIFDRVPVLESEIHDNEEPFTISTGWPCPDLPSHHESYPGSFLQMMPVTVNRLQEIYAEADDQDETLESSVYSILASLESCQVLSGVNVQYQIEV